MRKAIEFWAGRPVAVVMALCALLGAGVWAAAALPRERLPELRVPRVLVEASYPGMGAAEIRSLIALPLEDALASVKGVQSLKSVSRDGLCSAILDFRWGEDPSSCTSRVREAIDGVYPVLPEGAEKPVALPYEADSAPLVVMSVRAKNGDLALARHVAEYELRSRLRRVDGVALVSVVGGREREIVISSDLGKAAARGMIASDLARIVARECGDLPAGIVAEGDRELVVVAQGRPSSISALGSLTLLGPSGPFPLSDVAEVREKAAPRSSVFVADGVEAVALEIRKRPFSDPAATARRVAEEVSRAMATFGSEVDIRILSDSSRIVSRGISDLFASALFGSLAAACVIAFFLRDFRTSILVASSIPFSAAASLALLALAGKSLNGMSLGGIALGIGLISDNAVVVLDLLAGAFGETAHRPSARNTAKEVSRVSGSTFGGTATTIIVFFPVLFLPGPIGALFSDLAVSLIAAVGAGWLFSLFAVPALYRIFWKASPDASFPKTGKTIVFLRRLYRTALPSAFRKPLPVAAAAMAAAGLGLVLTLTRPAAFLSANAETELEAVVVFPPGASLDRVAREGAVLSASLSASPFVAGAYGSAGAEADDPLRRADGDYCRERLVLRCALRDGASAAAAASDVRARSVSSIRSDVSLSVRSPLDPTAAVLGLTSSRRIAVRGSTPEEASGRAADALEFLKRASGSSLASASASPEGKRTEIRAIPDREVSAVLGLSVTDFAENARIATEGVIVARLERAGRGTDVRLTARPSAKGVLSDLYGVPVSARPIPASAAARIKVREGAAALARQDRNDVVYVEAEGAETGDSRLDRTIRTLCAQRPEVSRADESAFLRYSSALVLTVVLTLVLLYLSLGAQFESFALPLLLLVSSPLAMAGAGPSLLLVGAGLDSGSVIGLIVLFGTAVNNAITLWEHAAEKVRAGAAGAAACYTGAVGRLRPIIVTTATTVVALVPVAFFSPPSAQRSMASAMLGGMIVSTALSLFVTPPLLAGYVEKRRKREGDFL